ncbi:MAG: hypothetical protein IPM91_04545 [Bacteroidetes bacterium]|nr:hypothetical protein [Bacteroidota bacterium]
MLNLGGTQSTNLEDREYIPEFILQVLRKLWNILTTISQTAITGNAVEGATDNGNLNLTIVASIMNG